MPTPEPKNREHRVKLFAAVIAGLTAGAARAVTDWLLQHLTNAR